MATEVQILANRRLSTILCPLHLSRTLYKSALYYAKQSQFPKSQMNVSSIITKDYEKRILGQRGKNKANQSQFKPNFPQNKANSNPIKPNQIQFQALPCKNGP